MTQIINYPSVEYTTNYTTKTNKKGVGKILTKDFISKTYIDLNLSFDSLKEIYGFSYKIFYKSYCYWFTVQERKKIGGGKIAVSQRNRNSNRYNTGILKVLLNKDVLVDFLNKKYAVEKMGFLLNVAPQTVKKNLEYYGLTKELVKHGLDYERVLTVTAIDDFLGTSILKGLEMSNYNLQDIAVDTALRQLRDACLRLDEIQRDIQKTRYCLVSKFIRRNLTPVNSYKLPTSKTNKLVYSILKELNYEPDCELQLKDRFYDFFLPELNILLEIDAEGYHANAEQINNDIYKNKIAQEHGYKLLRVVTGKSDKKVTIKRKIEACLNQVK